MGVRVQIIGGETREIRCDGECHELALDLSGHPMATMLFWVQSEQDCLLRVANWDSNGASAVLVPNRLDGFMPFMVHAGEPHVRVPALSRNALCGSDSALPPDGDNSVSRPTSNHPNYAIGIQCGALYEVSCARLPCVCSRVRFGCATGSIVQDFELTFSPLSTGVLDPANAVDDQAAAIYDPQSTIWSSSGSVRADYHQPTCSVGKPKQVRLRLYVRQHNLNLEPAAPRPGP